MNVYDSARMADVLAPLGYGRPKRRTTPTWSSSTPATSARRRRRRCSPSSAVCARRATSGASNGRRHDHRRRRLRRPGRGRGDPAPRAGRRHRARAADLSPPAGDGGARDARPRAKDGNGRRGAGVLDTDFPVESKFDHLPAPSADRRSPPSSRSRKAATSSAPSASCPIRAAPNSRAPWRRSSQEARRAGRAGAREITLLGQNVNAYHGEAPDRWSEWGLGRLIRHWPTASMACCASATPPRIRATWTTT